MLRNKNYSFVKNNDMVCRHALIIETFGTWRWNIDKDELSLSKTAARISGYKFDYIKNMFEFINSVACEEDKALAIKDLEDYINGILPFYRSTFRIKGENGKAKWVLLRGKIFKNEKENCSYLTGIMMDVIGNKLLEGCDNLTQLPNREFFFKKLHYAIKEAEEHNKKGALIYIDINNLKALNENFGHNIADLILKSFSKSINYLISAEGELARLAGEEFAILINDFDDIKRIEKICIGIRDYLQKPLEICDNKIYIYASLGVAVFPDDSSDADELLKFCDFAVYKSKHKGKNMYTFFDKQMEDLYSRKLLIENELKNSISNNELDVFYQPQVNASNNKIEGVEALVRWKNDKLGNVSPAEFIPIAEKNGYIQQIDDWVLDRSLRNVRTWIEKGYKFNTICLNVSPIQLRKSSFKDKLLNKCALYNVPPSLLEIEITERALMETDKDKIKDLYKLMECGVHVAIDDFGTGYSSLVYLIKLPINTLKIDKSFVDNIQNHKNRAVIGSIVTLAKSLKYKIIVEGVESKEQMDILINLGCNIIQGYYFSKPLPENEIEHLFESRLEC